MTLRALFAKPAAWWIVAGLAAVIFCFLATNDAVYVATSPPSFDYYVVLRKIYSVVAFAVVGYPVARARSAAGMSATPLVVGTFVGAYSAIIEVLQYFVDPPPEGLLSNAIDVLCGVLGGVLAAAIVARVHRA